MTSLYDAYELYNIAGVLYAEKPDDFGRTDSLFIVWDGNFYVNGSQNRSSYDLQSTGIAFKKGEVNHIRVDYTINDDISQGAWGQATDTEIITVTNSEGTKQVTKNVSNRFQSEPNKLTSAAGISYFTRTYEAACQADVYIDNLKVYQEKSYQNGNYTLIKDNFDSLNNGDNWNSNRVDLWRIEGGTDWNGDLSDTELSIEAAVTGKENVLKLANTATDSIIRGGRGWSWDSAEFIQPGETVSFEFDIYAENNSKFMFGIVGGNRNEKCEEYAGNSALFFVKNDSTTDVYCASSQLRDDNGAAKYDGVYFARNAFNHVKIDYTLNEDVSTGTKDIVSITVENDLYGTTAGTFNMSSRYDYGKGDSNYPMLPSIP